MAPCGRFSCSSDDTSYFKRVQRYTKTDEWRCRDKYKPSFNVPPGAFVTVIYDEYQESEQSRKTVMHTMKWGLIPAFGRMSAAPINARSDSLSHKPCFSRLVNSCRCCILVDGFYEWQKKPSKKAYFVYNGTTKAESVKKEHNCEMKIKPTEEAKEEEKEERPFLILLGLYDCWNDKATDEKIHTFTIITTASKSFASVHDRQPCILNSSSQDIHMWMDARQFPFLSVQRFLAPFDGLAWHQVTPKVGNFRYDSPDCITLFEEPVINSSTTTKHNIADFFKKSKKEEEDVKCEQQSENKKQKLSHIDCDDDDVDVKYEQALEMQQHPPKRQKENQDKVE